MASKGSRVIGTDGSDFSHRETVPRRYQLSIQYKDKLRRTLVFFHLPLWLLMVVKMADDALDRLDILIPDLAELSVPKPILWEYIWMLSIIPSCFALASLPRNRIGLLNLFIYGNILLGILPVIGGIVYYFWELVEYAQVRHTKNLFLDLPVVVLWNIFFFLALQIHCFSWHFARQLIRSWDKGFKSR
ncbi:protein jagunal-like [Paramacrobiotus metropolitanus]|uniref:protein jagunal-like n=1 Tax=Paramacrobiotus metropolitanus TaxID=2943436 RepID=UPI002445CCB9|nr:protein jagunal-like [Paramacrobiotus metropolitanus]